MSKGRNEVIYYTRLEDGRFVSRAVQQRMKELEGQRVEVMLRPRRSYRTLPQNNYYWGVVVHLIADHMRELGVEGPHGGPITDQQVHELMAARFLRRSQLVNPDTGEYIDVVVSTSSLTKSEFADYVEQVKSWAMDTFGLEIPAPNEQLSLA